MSLRCGAKLRGGRGFCQRYPLRGMRRCKLHRGREGEKTGYSRGWSDADRAKGQETRRRWVALKEAGVVERTPYGAKRTAQKSLAERRRETAALKTQMRERALALTSEIPPEYSPAAHLQVLNKLGMEHLERALEYAREKGSEWLDDPKLLQIMNAASLQIMSRAIRVDEGQMKAAKTDRLAEILERLKEVRKK